MSNATIKDVARLAGVGLCTVSRVINNSQGVHPDTRKKAEKVIEELEYVPNNSARSLKRMQSNFIGLLICGVSNMFFIKAMNIANEKLHNTLYTVILREAVVYEDEIDNAITFIREKRLTALIIIGYSGCDDKEKLKDLKDMGVPCVFVSVPHNSLPLIGKNFPCITINDRLGAYNIVKFLCSLSHQRIMLITAKSTYQSVLNLRIEGYQRALRRNGICFDGSLVRKSDGPGVKDGYDLMKQILESPIDFTAVFVTSDELAIGVCKAIFDKGLKVPDDISVAGFDSMELTRYYNPSITTLMQPIDEIMDEAINILIKSIESGMTAITKTYDTIVIPLRFAQKMFKTRGV